MVSRDHARVLAGQPPRVQDLLSSNGTEVDGERLGSAQMVELDASNIVELGDAFVIVQDLYVPTDSRPARFQHAPPAESQAPCCDDCCHDDSDRLTRLLDLLAASSLNLVLQGHGRRDRRDIAELVHARSTRASGPFCELRCAAHSQMMLEVELFGLDAAAFGPARARAGLLEAASGGCLLLEEVAEIGPALQTKLAVALASSKAVRIGGSEPHPIDPRCLAASSTDLSALVKRGVFSWELYMELAGACLTVPAH
jgi:transcriptional regulator of acetoin/glycerol metabolism